MMEHKFTREEREELSDKQQEVISEITRLKQQLADIIKAYEQAVDEKWKTVRRLSKLLKDKSEMREREVRVAYFPSKKLKEFYALEDDKHEHCLGSAPMEKSDWEMRLPGT